MEVEEELSRLSLKLQLSQQRASELLGFVRHRAAAKIQSYVRMLIIRRNFRKKMRRREAAALEIQRIARAAIVRMTLVSSTSSLGFAPNSKLLLWWRRHHHLVEPSSVRRFDCARQSAALVLQRFFLRVKATARFLHRRGLFDLVESSALRIQTLWRGHCVRKQTKNILQELRWQRHEHQLEGFLKRAVKAPRLRRQHKAQQNDDIERRICRMMTKYHLPFEVAKRRVLNDISSDRTHQYEQSVIYPETLPAREWHYASYCNERHISTLGDDSSDSEDLAIEEERMKPLRRPEFKPRREIVYDYHLSPSRVAEMKIEATPPAEDESKIAASVTASRRRRRRKPSATDSTSSSVIGKSKKPVHYRLAYG